MTDRSQITPGLFVAGCDYGILDVSGVALALLCAPDMKWHGDSVAVMEFPFADDLGGMSIAEQKTARAAAELAFGTVRDGDSVLVACREGRNRSALVAALALVYQGTEPEVAITIVQERRMLSSGLVLTNRWFREFVMKRGEIGPLI